MKTKRIYTREIQKQFGYHATWLPGSIINLGDIGVIENNVFKRIGNIQDKNISFETLTDPAADSLEYQSRGAVSVSLKAKGQDSPQASSLAKGEAGIIVEFSKENSILFKANDIVYNSIDDQIKLGKKVISLFLSGEWDKSWVIVTELATAQSATILISNSSQSKLELKASVEASIDNIDIADASIGLQSAFSKDLFTKIVAQESLSPLFRVSKIKSRPFNSPVFRDAKRKKIMLFNSPIDHMDLITIKDAESNKEALYFEEMNVIA